jgi:hypothetical protein
LLRNHAAGPAQFFVKVPELGQSGWWSSDDRSMPCDIAAGLFSTFRTSRLSRPIRSATARLAETEGTDWGTRPRAAGAAMTIFHCFRRSGDLNFNRAAKDFPAKFMVGPHGIEGNILTRAIL